MNNDVISRIDWWFMSSFGTNKITGWRFEGRELKHLGLAITHQVRIARVCRSGSHIQIVDCIRLQSLNVKCERSEFLRGFGIISAMRHVKVIESSGNLKWFWFSEIRVLGHSDSIREAIVV